MAEIVADAVNRTNCRAETTLARARRRPYCGHRPSTMTQIPSEEAANGLPFALGAYLLWGLLPLYLMLVHWVPALEFVGWRVIWTVPVCLIIVAVRRQGREVLAAAANPRVLGLLALSALLIGGNWLVYVIAIQAGHVFAASLGYYINPLVNVLVGTIFLREKLSRRQWAAVAIAAAGVSLLVWGAREMLGISLTLAFSFCAYGLVRKFAPVGSLPGLTIESALLAIPAAGVLALQAAGPHGLSLGKGVEGDLLIAFSGIATAVPLLLFAVAARRMDYSTLGFVQFLAPTIVFLLGLLVFREPLREVQLACFIAIWAAIAIFSWDLWVRRTR
jgi:chloramphenicol-sensitive protein RarD